MTSDKRNRRKNGKKVLRKSGKPRELHCMQVPSHGEQLLLPTTILEEVIDFTAPEPMAGSPPWLLGEVEWDNRQVPVFDFSALINGEDPESPGGGSHIMVIKSLSEDGRIPYLGLLLSNLPKPLKIDEGTLEEIGDDKRALGVFSRVNVEGKESIIPDIDRLTHLVTHAAFGALPITQLEQ
jgi:chemosensory pili system protein ChpC